MQAKVTETNNIDEVIVEDRAKQNEAFTRMLEMMNIPAVERPRMMTGVGLFYDRGWPSNYVTVGMAARAGAGLVPPIYEGFHSVAKYKALIDAEKAKE